MVVTVGELPFVQRERRLRAATEHMVGAEHPPSSLESFAL